MNKIKRKWTTERREKLLIPRVGHRVQLPQVLLGNPTALVAVSFIGLGPRRYLNHFQSVHFMGKPTFLVHFKEPVEITMSPWDVETTTSRCGASSLVQKLQLGDLVMNKIHHPREKTRDFHS